MIRKFFLKTNKLGFTLVETIVALAIFSVVITAVYYIYDSNHNAYNRGQNLAEITQNGRVILERITRDLRQASKIVGSIPLEELDGVEEIIFQDGHLPSIVEQGNIVSSSQNSVVLPETSSSDEDYYKDMFLQVVSGSGAGQIKKIYKYEGATRTATLDSSFGDLPNSESVYKIDSNFYYVHYYRDSSFQILKEIYSYCPSLDGTSCVDPGNFVAFDSVVPAGQALLQIELESPKVVGEYASQMIFWGSQPINVFLELQKGGSQLNLETGIFGRNL